ncbi:BAG domain-containing protein Samui isoform X2 [Drosophila busckii]|uniref:BAG domain-containing protein Samui isoform X2 n=1 Tax=Drosophila busckii TaxID=30019 RepID=UPI00083EF3B4|nr:BAG domain-containing protein Samui isoform X2 [Drosophila busckii]
MKPTVIAGANNANGNAGNGINIPINRDYNAAGMQSSSPQQQQQPQQQQPYPQQSNQYHNNQTAYGSPRQQPQQQHHHHQQMPTNQQQHFQPSFGFEPDMDMDMDNMFPRSRLGRLHHDPFAGFGGTHFGFPQFGSMGRRGRVAGGANHHNIDHDDDFFNRLPSEFRQYIPESFGGRRSAGAPQPQPQQQQQPHPQTHYQQDYGMPQQQQPAPAPQSPSKRLCDAAIQTEDMSGRSEVDCAPAVNLNQHGLRNTMDMGVKSAAEQEQALRSHSAPPPEQQQLNQQYQQQQQQQHQQQQRPTPPPQFGTQTSPPVQAQQQPPQFHKTYYAPQQQTHPQQKQQTPPPPQTPGGTYVRTIPIFVEGRTEPIINAHKDIPNQNAAPQAHAQAQAHAQSYYPSQQQQPQRPSPLNTQQAEAQQQQQMDAGVGLPPQTPHTVDSIKKIQDIQRDVLELMAKVEQFKGTRQDKEYVYLDEMLTRNLLKLDTIDTNGKDSIRLARKEAIKCIQASVNVLDAKAEENARRAAGAETAVATEATTDATATEAAQPAEPQTPQPLDATKILEPIPLPAPPAAAEATATTEEAAKSETTTVSSSTE